VCGDGYVYNIEVEDNNNYFANGYLVHNCHKAVGSPTKVMQFYKVLSALSCRYKYGLTATPERSDGLEKSMFALLGGICVEVEKETVAHTTCPVKVQMVQTDYFPSMDIVLAGDGTLSYSGLVEDLTHDEDRFNFVLDYIPHNAGAVIVLANRVEYLQRLCKAYGGNSLCLSGMGNSKAAKAERKEALRKLNDGELDAVFATYTLAREGLDIPNLRYVVFATPEKDSTTVIQAAGRVGRRAEGKEYGTVIDFEDNFGMYHGWAKKRKGYYKKLDCEIEVIE
jgi:superfamily II DNA or RNA helicase